jgi:hypothetical protein
VRDTALLFERVRASGSSAEEVRDNAWLSADVMRNNSGSEAEPAERTLDRVADNAESRPESRDEGLSESICERRLRREEERESSGVVVKPVRRSSKIGSVESGVQRREGEDSAPRSNMLIAGRKGGAPFMQLLKCRPLGVNSGMPVTEEEEDSDLSDEEERIDLRVIPAGYRSEELEESDDRDDMDLVES